MDRIFHARPRLWLLLVFLLLPYLFFTIGVDLTRVAIAPGDGSIQGVPSKVFTADLHLWNPAVQAGTYPLQYIGWQALYPPGILAMRIFPPVLGYNILLLAHYTLAGFGMFLFLEQAGLRRMAAFLGGLAFMFCGFLAAHKGHHTMLMAAAYLPAVFYFFERYARGKRTGDLLLSGLMFGLCILADYLAVPMYIGMLLLPYMLCTLLIEPGFRRPGTAGSRWENLLYRYGLLARAMVLVFGVGLLLAFVQVIPIVESLEFVTRQSITYDFFTSYAFSPRMLPLLLFPFFYGANVPESPYMGPWNLTELTGYMGILPLLFAVLALLLFWKKNWRIIFWGAAALAAFVLALGGSTPFYRLMFHVPVYNMFRVPARNWLEVNFAVAALSGYFVHYISRAAPEQRSKFLRVLAGLLPVFIAGVVIILTSGYRLGTSTAMDAFLRQNSHFTNPFIARGLAIMGGSLGVLALLWRFRSTLWFWLVTALLVFVDLFSFGFYHDTAYPDFAIFNQQANPVAQYFATADPVKEQYRILPLSPSAALGYEQSLYPLTNTLYGLNTVNGYGAIWLQDFSDLTSFAANGMPTQRAHLLENSVVLSVLATRYLIASNPAEIALIEQQRLTAAQPQISVPNSLPAERFQFSAAQFRDGVFQLQSSAPGVVSLIEAPLGLEAGASYEITLSARRIEGAEEHLPLVIDFFGENYDAPVQEMVFAPEDLTGEFRTYHARFPAGEAPPAQAMLRIFTFSPGAYEVKDITLARGNNVVPYWGVGQAQENAPLYVRRFVSRDGLVVYENRNFLPRARFIQQVIPVKDSESAIQMLRYDAQFDPANSALVEGWSGATTFAAGVVRSSDYTTPEVVQLTVETGETGFLVLADAYYVGWKAYVDGVETPIYKTNAITRGIRIDGMGQHNVRFQFVPLSFYVGLAVSLVTLLGIVMFAVRSLRDKPAG